MAAFCVRTNVISLQMAIHICLESNLFRSEKELQVVISLSNMCLYSTEPLYRGQSLSHYKPLQAIINHYNTVWPHRCTHRRQEWLQYQTSSQLENCRLLLQKLEILIMTIGLHLATKIYHVNYVHDDVVFDFYCVLISYRILWPIPPPELVGEYVNQLGWSNIGLL